MGLFLCDRPVCYGPRDNGIKLRNMPSSNAVDILFNEIWSSISQIDGWDDFVANKTDTYRKELIEYLHDVLSINGTISHLDKSNLSDTYKEYELSGKTCNLCNVELCSIKRRWRTQTHSCPSTSQTGSLLGNQSRPIFLPVFRAA